jgi:hypothetical protein
MIVSLDLRTCRINPRQVKQAGKSKVRLHKKKQGMLLVDQVGNRRSWAILAQNFSLKSGGKQEK